MATRWKYEKAASTPGRVCVDCKAERLSAAPVDGKALALRPAPHPGPRCHTHHNKKKRDARLKSKVAHVERTYSLTAEEYDAIYAAQGGHCALCTRTGAAKRLAVDHDHHQAMLDGHAPDKGCRNCVRGLVCSTCNDVLAHARSNPAYFELGAAYLRQWPARTVLGRV